MSTAGPGSRAHSPDERAGGSLRLRLAMVAVVMIVAVGSWLPLIAEYPQTWDEVQYILGVRKFDLANHQPHPPGYYLHVKTAAALQRMGLQPHTALVALNVAAGAAFAGLMVWWVSGVGGPWAGAAAGVLVAFSPLLSTAATEGRSYMTGALGAAVVGYLCWRILRGETRWCIPVGIALGLTAGFRPSAAVLLAPLWLWTMLRAGGRRAVAGVMAAALTAVVWVAPFLVEVGGLDRYLEISGRLGERVSGSAPLLGGGIGALVSNLDRLAEGLVLLIGIGVIGFPRGLKSPLGRPRMWLLLWLAPPLAVFILMHTGSWLYVMVLAAPLLVVVSVGVKRALLDRFEGAGRIAALAALALIHLVVIHTVMAGLREGVDSEMQAAGAALRPLADARTVVITSFHTDPEAGEEILPLRHAGYLLPEAHVYVFPLDLVGTPGTMPNSMHRMSSQAVTPPVVHRDARRLLLLGEGLKSYLPDDREARRIFDGDMFSAWVVPIEDGEAVILGADGALAISASGG